jgi:PPM family protein phosphatase
MKRQALNMPPVAVDAHMIEGGGTGPMFDASFCFGVRSHIGQRRRNEDSVRVPSAPEPLSAEGSLFAVADGMGGHSGGGLASRVACRELEAYYQRLPTEPRSLTPPLLSRVLMETVFRIDRRLRRRGLRDAGMAEMGTTLSCLVLTESHSIISHVGDSRIYRIRHDHLTRLTTDHTFVQDMIFEGEVDPKEAERHPLRHLLTRVVGTSEPLPLVDTRIDRIQPKDRYLLCTDGLSNTVTFKAIADLLSKGNNASGVAERLVAQALRDNARDNITAVVVIL